jgi:multidrug efflux pump subunit AcrA (membrane-fusion protein)
MNPHAWISTTLAVFVLLLVGCGKKAASSEAAHDHSEHAEGEEGEDSGVTFKEGRGLQFSPEVITALSLSTAEAEERPLSAEINLTAQVFATAPRILASARVSTEQADTLEKSRFSGAKLAKIDRSIVPATRLVDLVFELDAASTHKVGDFVSLAFAGETASALSVMKSAVLDGATGTFVYVVNGDAYLRTPVTVGMRSSEFIEITDGLYAGDVVVVSPVEQLWLAELRLTKGGGHSH